MISTKLGNIKFRQECKKQLKFLINAEQIYKIIEYGLIPGIILAGQGIKDGYLRSKG
jgi:hypothetical protein